MLNSTYSFIEIIFIQCDSIFLLIHPDLGKLVISIPKDNVTNTSVWVRLNGHRFTQNIPGYFIQLDLYSVVDQKETLLKEQNVTRFDLVKDLVNFIGLDPYHTYNITGKEIAGTYSSKPKTAQITTKEAG